MIEENEKITKKEGYFKMNKKSLLMMMVTICLIAVVGVGATLAYLSDETDALTNTFTFVENGIDITLDEAAIDENNKATNERVQAGDGNDYTNIVPGMVMDKDPTVTVNANSVNCYVVVSVENPNSEDVLKIGGAVKEDGTVNTFASNVWANPEYWTLEKEEGNVKFYSYNTVVTKSGENQALKDVFETVTFNNEYEPVVGEDGKLNVEISNIVIKAAAVQADNNTKKDAVAEAIAMIE